MPTTADTSLAQCTSAQGARQPHGELTATMKTKKARPSTATGIPRKCDCVLVVTLTQLTVAVAGHPAKLVLCDPFRPLQRVPDWSNYLEPTPADEHCAPSTMPLEGARMTSKSALRA